MESIKNLPIDDLQAQITALGEPAFRAKQIFKWLYQKRVDSFEQMTNIAKSTQAKLAGIFEIRKLPVIQTIASPNNDAVKFGLKLFDEATIESVLLIDGDRRTACLSSQVGCGLKCSFCATGAMGLLRNLTLEEITGQLIAINDYQVSKGDKLVTNIVFMGMGEALSNFINFRGAIDIIRAEDAFFIGGRRITVSTAGVVPSIDRLIAQDLNLGLAISLNHYNNAARSKIMPVNDTWPIESLIDAARRYFEATGRRVTFEYVVVAGQNDTDEAVQALVKLLDGLNCKINLIPINPTSTGVGQPPADSHLESMSTALNAQGITATIRKSRGQEISGACGQLQTHCAI